MGDITRYTEELQKKLAHSEERLLFPERKRRRHHSELRDSSVEPGEGLVPAITDDLLDEMQDEDGDGQAGPGVDDMSEAGPGPEVYDTSEAGPGDEL